MSNTSIDHSEKLRAIKLIVMDVDGTMTDGSMNFGPDGEVMKRFSVRDGMGITLARRAGLLCAIMTSEVSAIVTKRAEKLGIEHVILGSRSKKTDLKQLADKIGIVLDEIVFVGDDVNDALAMQSAGFSACPQDATSYIKSIASYVCEHKGGYGCVREVIEMVLQAQSKPTTLPEHW